MEMQGEASVPASRQFVWDALNDPQVLQASIPGCEAMALTAPGEYTATVVSKVGPIKARFVGKVTLSNVVAPKSYTLTGEGSGGTAGFAKADIDVALDALEADVTRLRYTVRANVGGKLAQLGSRMIDAAAQKSADDFFEAFTREVQQRAPGATQARPQALSDLLSASATATAAAPAVHAPLASQPGLGSALQVMSLPAAATAAAATEALAGETIKVWIADQIAVITLNRPKSRNAMTLGMWTAIPGILAALQANPEVRAVILTGAGEDFCAGADIPEFEKVRADARQATAYEEAVDACCDALYTFPKPTIAVLRGYCLGGGAHLAMSCDFRYAAHDAMFGIPAARLSIIYGVRATRKLLSLVGLTQARRILYGAQRFNADEALRIGFVDHVARSAVTQTPSWWGKLMGVKPRTTTADPMADAREFAQAMAENAPLSMAGAKFQLNGMARGTGALDLDAAEALIAAAAGSDDYREGRQAFAQKRKPAFQGR